MEGSYERISRGLLKGQPKSQIFCVFDADIKRLLIGTKSLHRTQQSRTWRLFWRLKYIRMI